MTNAVRGQVSLELGDQVYTLEYSIDALIQLEDRLGVSAVDLLGLLRQDTSMKFARTLLWGGLREHHKALTEKQAGELFRQPGGDQIKLKVTEAFIAAWPDVASPENPPMRQTETETAPAGTGASSSSSGASAAAANPTPSGGKPRARSRRS